LFPAGRNGGPTTQMPLSLLSSPALLNVRSTAAEAVAAAAGGGKAGRPTATTMEAEAVAGAAGAAGTAKGGSPGGRKGPVIKRAPSRASRSSLANEGFFGGRPRRPLKFTVTGLPPTVRPVAAELPAVVEESIEEEGGGSALRR
jgi:hypothetical protein